MNKNPLYLSLLLLTAAFAVVADDAASCASSCNTTCSQSKNYFTPRAFSSYSSRNLILEKSLLQVESEREEWNGTLSAEVEYMSNFGQKCGTCKNIGAMPFWSGTNTLTIGNNNGKAQLDAFQFGLGNVKVDSDGIGGVIQLNPQIQQIGADFLLYFTQRKNERGFYFKIDAPIGAMSIDPRFTELNTTEPVENNYFTGSAPASLSVNYESDNYPSLASRPDTISEAFFGALPTNATYNSNNYLYLKKGRIADCKQSDIRLSDLSATVGYNVYGTEKSLVGVGFKATFPTGSVPTAEYMLEPVFGRGGAWGIGGEVMAHHKAWENEAKSRYVDLWLQGEVLHLVPGRSPNWRSFDLKANGAGSKYLLVQYYPAFYDTNSFGAEFRSPDYITQAVNITTLPVISKFAIEGSVALMADFHCNDWNVGIGGEFWGRSRECLQISGCDTCEIIGQQLPNLNDYAVIGRQVGNNTYIQGQASVLNPTYCEPLATINKSQNQTFSGTAGAIVLPTTLPTGIKDATVAANRIPADYSEALDIAGAAAAKAYTGKIFGQVGYNFKEHRYSPTISVVGGAEFTNNSNNAVQLWSVALQGALNF